MSSRTRKYQAGRWVGNGFTLIELLVVIGIISILAAIAVPNLLDAQTRSKVAAAKNALRVLEVGVESYRIDHQTYPYTESYRFNLWVPPGGRPHMNTEAMCTGLTTPIAYLTTIPQDPFKRPRMVLKNIDIQPINGPEPTCPVEEKEIHLYVEAAGEGAVIDETTINYERAGFGFLDDFETTNVGIINVLLPCDPCCGTPCPWNGRLYVWDYPHGDAGEAYHCEGSPVEYTLFSIGPDGQYAAPDRNGRPLRSRFEINNRYDPTNGTVSPGNIVRFAGGAMFP